MSDEAKAKAAESTLGQFQSLFKNMPEGCALHEVVTDEQGRPIDYIFLDINPAFERLTGLRKADVIGRRLTEVLPGLEPFWFEAYGRVAPSGEPVVFEGQFPAPVDRWYQVWAYQPGPDRFATIFLDVTAHHDLESQLRESRSKYQALIETTNDFIWEMDAQGRYTYCSPQLERLWGMTPEGMIGKTPFDVMPPEEQAGAAGQFAELARSPQPFSGLETAALVPGGRLIHIETSGVPFFDEHGRLMGFRGVSRDITKRHWAEEALRRSEARLKLAQESAGAGVWDWDIPSGELDWSDGYFRLFGLDPLENKATFETWRSVLHPEDRVAAEERINEAISSRTALSNRYRIVLPSGEVRWINALGNTVYGEKGEALRMSGICLDITGLKQAEEQLEQSNRRVKEILASIQDDFYVLDSDWRFRYVSRQFTARIGKEPKDLVGNVIWDMFPKHLGTIYEENLRAAMEKREIRRFEIEGKYTQAWYSMAAFPSADGVTVLGVDITKRKRDEEALLASEARFRSVLDNSRDVVYRFDIQAGRFEYVSPSCAKVVGYSADHFMGLDGQAALEMIHPDDRQAFLEAVARSEETGDAEVEYRQEEAAGGYRWVSNHISVVRDRAGRPAYRDGNIRDVTERKKAEALRQALAEQEMLRLGAAVEQAPDAVVMLDLDGTVRYANAAFGFVNKMAKDEAKGRSYFDAFAPRSTADQMRQALGEGRAWQGSLTRPIRGGRPVELEVALSAVTDPAGAVIGGLVTEKDVTYEMVLQRQLRQGQKMEALGTLAGGIAHDFNNILNPIFISIELALLEPTLDPGVRSHLEVGLKAAERGRDLVKQVIAFSRQKEKERKPFRAAPVVREAVNFLRVSLPSTIEIRSDVQDETGSILGDPAHLQQIVMNLSSNAAYAMRQSGGVLTVNLDGVKADDSLVGQVPGLRPGPCLRMTVADTGTGMGPATRERLFDPFFTTKGPGEGSGMGLPVVDGIVRDYGGAIAVETEEGRGSTFTVYLPRGEFDESPAEGPPDDLPRGTGRVLLIDDEETQIYSIRRMLEKLGYEVTAMTDGRQALDRFRSEPRGFNLVITDQTMPHLTGIQVAEELLKVRPDVPIILCTGYSEVVDAKKARALGIREFLMKPYSVREMAEVVRRTLAGRS